jgi:hypothetical protein
MPMLPGHGVSPQSLSKHIPPPGRGLGGGDLRRLPKPRNEVFELRRLKLFCI